MAWKDVTTCHSNMAQRERFAQNYSFCADTKADPEDLSPLFRIPGKESHSDPMTAKNMMQSRAVRRSLNRQDAYFMTGTALQACKPRQENDANKAVFPFRVFDRLCQIMHLYESSLSAGHTHCNSRLYRWLS
jgi:hypothetical protein